MSPFALRVRTLNAAALGNESAPAVDEVQLVNLWLTQPWLA